MFGGSACGWVVGASGLKRAVAVAVVWVGFTGVSLSISLSREREACREDLCKGIYGIVGYDTKVLILFNITY